MLFDKEDKQAGKTTGAGTAVQRIANGTQSQSHSQASTTFLDALWMSDKDMKMMMMTHKNDSNTNIFSNEAMTIEINQKKTCSRLCIRNISIEWLSRWSGCKSQDEKMVLVLWSSPPPRICARRALRIWIPRARLVTHARRVLTRVRVEIMQWVQEMSGVENVPNILKGFIKNRICSEWRIVQCRNHG